MNATCDACPATAKVSVGKPGMEILYLCMHHFNASAEALYAQHWLVLDRLDQAAGQPAGTSSAAQRIVHRSIRR